VRGDGARQPEVGHLDLSPVGDQHVLGLDVAVDQPGGVRGGQRRGHRLDQLDGPPGVHRGLAGDELTQREPLHVLHHDVGTPGIGALVEDRHDVRVRQVRGGARFGVEA
jgi:hypothetical protein